jgi:hypothetical protein
LVLPLEILQLQLQVIPLSDGMVLLPHLGHAATAVCALPWWG